MKTIFPLALLCALLPAAALADNAHPRIALATDLHFISPTLTDHGVYFQRVITQADGKVMMYSEELILAFVDQLLQDPPDALILSGDLTFNGATQSHIDLSERLQPLRDAGIRIFVLPGNHDLRYAQAARFIGDHFEHVPSPSPEEFASIWANDGFSTALSKDEHSLSYIAELAPGYRLLMLDVNTLEERGAVRAATLAWVIHQLEAAERDGVRVIAVSHQTLLRHNPLFEQGFRMENADALLARYERHGVLLNLSGHMHIQHIAESEAGFPEIVTSALSVSPCQYGLLTLGETLQYDTVRVDVSSWAKRKGATDPNLLDFAGHALSFFVSSTLRQAAPILGREPGGASALTWLANVNVGYFSGQLSSLQKNEEALALLQAKAPFWYVYCNSILPDLGKDYRHFTLVP